LDRIATKKTAISLLIALSAIVCPAQTLHALR
jgi:hypothetical protein